jgi:hypothetical protein
MVNELRNSKYTYIQIAGTIPDRPYVAIIKALWHNRRLNGSDAMRMRVAWYYMADELTCAHNLSSNLAKVRTNVNLFN